MKFTDKEAIKLFNKVNSPDLWADIDGMEECDRDGRTDLDILADEVAYIVELWEEDGTSSHDELVECRRILRRTNYGKTMPFSLRTFKPIYSRYDIDRAKETVNEYNRLKRLKAKLEQMTFEQLGY